MRCLSRDSHYPAWFVWYVAASKAFDFALYFNTITQFVKRCHLDKFADAAWYLKAPAWDVSFLILGGVAAIFVLWADFKRYRQLLDENNRDIHSSSVRKWGGASAKMVTKSLSAANFWCATAIPCNGSSILAWFFAISGTIILTRAEFAALAAANNNVMTRIDEFVQHVTCQLIKGKRRTIIFYAIASALFNAFLNYVSLNGFAEHMQWINTNIDANNNLRKSVAPFMWFFSAIYIISFTFTQLNYLAAQSGDPALQQEFSYKDIGRLKRNQGYFWFLKIQEALWKTICSSTSLVAFYTTVFSTGINFSTSTKIAFALASLRVPGALFGELTFGVNDECARQAPSLAGGIVGAHAGVGGDQTLAPVVGDSLDAEEEGEATASTRARRLRSGSSDFGYCATWCCWWREGRDDGPRRGDTRISTPGVLAGGSDLSPAASTGEAKEATISRGRERRYGYIGDEPQSRCCIA